ncbi:hypothetical protein ACIQGZ_02290 [Streptomyces sp. NPDC092296]|uniref:hypothetical protein n=1 Tax=Streptomyces sp. NPDC092296 TaxID=3366012 RepID=UPI00381853E5
MLWERLSQAVGAGRPVYRVMHPDRQRRAMLELLCQICGGPASRTSRGWLFLANRTGPELAAAGGAEEMLTAQPPLCLPCAGIAVRQCPSLTGRHTAVRSRKPSLWGVWGSVYRPGGRVLEEVGEGASLPYGHPGTRWLLASQLIRELRRATPVDLTTELAGQNG